MPQASGPVAVRALVVGIDRQPIDTANVTVTSTGPIPTTVPLIFSSRTRMYAGTLPGPGKYRFEVAAPNLESQTRVEEVPSARPHATFVVAPSATDFYYRGSVQVPFQQLDRMAIAVRYGDQRSFDLIALDVGVDISALGFSPVAVPEFVQQQRVHVLAIPPNKRAEAIALEQQLGSSPLIRAAGQVVHLTNRSVAFLTSEVVVNLQPGAALPPLVDGHRLSMVRKLNWLSNGWLLRGAAGSEDVNHACAELTADPTVLWAEPNLYSTVVPHASGPDEFLGLQYHHPIIDSAGAWAITKGASVRIAVIDGGCKTNHEDLTSTFERAVNFEDFTAPVIDDEHGTKCAGIVAAAIDNTVGVAGVAGEAHFWAIQRQGGSDVDHAEMFLWCGGIDPASSRPGFPPVVLPAADVLSCSWGVESAAPAASIQAAFDTLHATGRNGRGVVIVFSVGNQSPNGEYFPPIYPWAAYGKNIAVAASTIPVPYTVASERKVTTSNYGPDIVVCAPGGEPVISANSERTLTTHRTVSPSIGRPFSYRNYALFGETSCACAQVAGVAALMIAARPQITVQQIKSRLQSTAVQIDAGNNDPAGAYVGGVSQWYGHGRVNAAAAVSAARETESLLDKLKRLLQVLLRYFIIRRKRLPQSTAYGTSS